MVCVTDFFSTFKTESPLGVWVANVELWSAVAELQHGLVSDLPHMSAKRSGGDLDIVRLSHFLESIGLYVLDKLSDAYKAADTFYSIYPE